MTDKVIIRWAIQGAICRLLAKYQGVDVIPQHVRDYLFAAMRLLRRLDTLPGMPDLD